MSRLLFSVLIILGICLTFVSGQNGIAAMQAAGMTASQIHQKYPYYHYFSGTNNGAGYLYYNGYSHGDGKGESTWERSVQQGIPGLDQQTLQAQGRQYFPMVDQSQLHQLHRPLYADPRVSQALDLQRLQPSPMFQAFNPQFAQNGIQQQLFFPGR